MKKLILFYVALYIRLSREDGDKEESDSIANQKKLLMEYISEYEDFILFDIYIDDGYSGTNFNRPGFQRMIGDIESGKVNCVIVKDLSRFGRDYIDTGRYLERIFPDLGVRFVAVMDNIDSMKRSYDMLLPIKNIFNEQYARDISNKVQATVKTKQKAGEFIGSFTSYGYKKSSKNKNKLVIDEYAACVVRRIFDLYVQGYGKQSIAKLLNNEGILCPTEYKILNEQNYKNGNRLESTKYWSGSTINSILHKEMYIGNMVQGTKHQRMRGKQNRVPKEEWIIVENTHEPIIDMETWNKVQTLLKKRTRTVDMETNRSLFAGFVKCGDCGRAMTKSMWRLTDGRKVYTLYCGTYKRHGKQFCTPHGIPLNLLEEVVMEDFKKIIESVHDLKGLVAKNNLAISEMTSYIDVEINKAKNELNRIQNLKKTVYEDYKDSLISKDEYIAYRQDYLQKEELYLKQIEALEKKEQPPTQDIFETPWLKKLLEKREIEHLDRDIVVEMVSEIQVYENRKIKIIYNFSGELEHLFSNIYNYQAKEMLV